MARESILDALGDIARDKGISRERLQEVVQDAVTAAAKRKFKNFNEMEARINVKSGELEVFRYKVVTDNFTDPENEIPLDEARKLDSLAEPGDEVEYEIENQELSRVIAQTARQLIFQKIREAEREMIYDNFKDRKGEVLNGIVSRTERNRIFITFNQVEAILYRREQIPNERYSPGEHIRVMLMDVINDPKEPSQLVISRADPMLLIKLFEMEVPEIYDGIVEIVTAAREGGRRAKIAVRSHDTDVDPVGACVGMRGARVQSIISELRGEKIDIINWVDDLPTYIANALAPAELTRIRIDEETAEIDVEVEPDQLSLAIGRQGQNVRLASKLIGYKINVNSTQDKALTLEEQIRERLLASQAELEGRTLGEDGPEDGAAPEGSDEATGGETPAEASGEQAAEPGAEAAEAPTEETEAATAETPTEETAEAAEAVVEASTEETAEVAETAAETSTEETAEAAETVAEASTEETAEVAETAAEASTEETAAASDAGTEETVAETSTEETAAETPTEETAEAAGTVAEASTEETAEAVGTAVETPTEETAEAAGTAAETPTEETEAASDAGTEETVAETSTEETEAAVVETPTEEAEVAADAPTEEKAETAEETSTEEAAESAAEKENE